MHGIRTKICAYLENVCNSALSENVSSYAQQLLVLVSLNPAGAIVVFPLPSAFVYNTENYYRLYDIISVAVWPEYTCLRPGSMQIATLEDRSLSTARGFFFPWKKGFSTRLTGTVDEILQGVNLNEGIPLMTQLTIPAKVNSIIVTGNSGSGKSIAVQSISEFIRRTPNTRIVYVDPKKSAGARWARGHPEIELVIPEDGERLEDFLLRVTELLSREVNNIFGVQNILFFYPKSSIIRYFKQIFLIILINF